MGLTIFYTLAVKKDASTWLIHDLLKGTARLARKIGCARVGKVLHSTETDPGAPPFFDTYPGNERCLPGGSGTQGWLVEVWPGEGCETAHFGVLREWRDISSKRRAALRLPWRYQTRWRLCWFCKTQYAGEHGWGHFLKCHQRIIGLLDYWREMGAQVKVHDEGGYWKSRSEKKLRKELEDYDRLVAGLGGAFKDACDATGGRLSVESPIFSYKNFEHLEHEGRQELGGRIQPLRQR